MTNYFIKRVTIFPKTLQNKLVICLQKCVFKFLEK